VEKEESDILKIREEAEDSTNEPITIEE